MAVCTQSRFLFFFSVIAVVLPSPCKITFLLLHHDDQFQSVIQPYALSIANRLITVRYTAPVDNIVWERDALQPIGQKIVKLLYDMSFDANPIILHVFSNGGAYLYKYLDLATKEFQSPLDVGSSVSILHIFATFDFLKCIFLFQQICGIIFDSSPGDFRLLSLYRMVSSVYGKERRFGCIISVFMTLAISAKWFAEVNNFKSNFHLNYLHRNSIWYKCWFLIYLGSLFAIKIDIYIETSFEYKRIQWSEVLG